MFASIFFLLNFNTANLNAPEYQQLLNFRIKCIILIKQLTHTGTITIIRKQYYLGNQQYTDDFKYDLSILLINSVTNVDVLIFWINPTTTNNVQICLFALNLNICHFMVQNGYSVIGTQK